MKALAMNNPVVALCLALSLLAPLVAGPVRAEAVAPTLPAAPLAEEQAFAALVEALDLDGVIAVMRDEGIKYGAELETDLFAQPIGAKWAERVSAIYDPARMRAVFVEKLQRELPAEAVASMLEFFASDLGSRIIGLELSARRALLDPAVKEAADVLRDEMIAAKAPRLTLLREFAEIGDLIESNVAGAMNANYAFVNGLAEGGGFPYEMTQEQIVTDVWSQEQEIRTETEDWLYAYLGMAYQPLSDADLAAYMAVSATAEGKALNRALFVAFDVMFTGISRDLGLAAANYIAGQEI